MIADLASLAIGALLLAYLVFALIHPEDFLMSPLAAAGLQFAVLIVALAVVHRPLGVWGADQPTQHRECRARG